MLYRSSGLKRTVFTLLPNPYSIVAKLMRRTRKQLLLYLWICMYGINVLFRSKNIHFVQIDVFACPPPPPGGRPENTVHASSHR